MKYIFLLVFETILGAFSFKVLKKLLERAHKFLKEKNFMPSSNPEKVYPKKDLTNVFDDQ